MSQRFFATHRKRATLQLALVFGLMLLGAAVSWGAGQPAAAQDTLPAPGGAAAAPGQTIPPPEGTPIYLPLLSANPTPVPTLPPRTYSAIKVQGGSLGWPAASSPDVNLALRGYTPTVEYLGLINIGGDTDDDAPQLAAVFNPARLPAFTATYRVYDWDWSCNPPTGCRGAPLDGRHPVTLLEVMTTPGEALAVAGRRAGIGSGFLAMVLYAEEGRLTVTYGDRDTPALGYVLHFEDVVVAPELLAFYRQLDADGRRFLPALRSGEVWGMAATQSIKVAVRDTGTFMDPRTCKDWWMDYRSQCTVLLARWPLTAPLTATLAATPSVPAVAPSVTPEAVPAPQP